MQIRSIEVHTFPGWVYLKKNSQALSLAACSKYKQINPILTLHCNRFLLMAPSRSIYYCFVA